jgi:WS/DGAT/MGAT family acyltransferase
MSTQRLAPLDEAFLAVESPSAHMHVGWAAVFDPPAHDPAPTFEELRDHIAARLPRAPRYRQMLRPVPFGLGAPAWVDDPAFDVRRHVRCSNSPELAELIDERLSKPLPRNRPLWEISIAPRLEDDRVAIVGKAHHCMVDGVAAVELASLLLDPDPTPPEPRLERWRPDPTPSGLALIAGGMLDFLRHQLELVRVPGEVVRAPGSALSRLGRAGRALADAARPAPARTALNRAISPLRHLGLVARPIEDLLEIKRAFDVTLNDVVLAASAGATRDLLHAHGEQAVRLKTMVPVNVRSGTADELGNEISFMFVDLPCDEPDPVRRLRQVHAATAECKEAGEAQGGSDVMRLLSFAPSPLRRLASGMVASPRAFNLVVSNIPGPREPLYMHGCRLLEAYPVVPITDEHTLSIGLTTVGDQAFFGLYGDRRCERDLTRLAASLERTIDELQAHARAPAARVRVPVGD